MALRPIITDEEKAKIVAKHVAGWTKARLCKKFRRTYTTVTAAIKEAEKSVRVAKKAKRATNKAKIVEVNAVLEGKLPDNDVVLNYISTFCDDLRKQSAEIKRLTIDLHEGVYEAEFTTVRRFKIGA